jgi:hypothetical protein
MAINEILVTLIEHGDGVIQRAVTYILISGIGQVAVGVVGLKP